MFRNQQVSGSSPLAGSTISQDDRVLRRERRSPNPYPPPVYTSLTYHTAVTSTATWSPSWRRGCSRNCFRTTLADDDYAALQQALIENPESGRVIRGSGGVRKLRWGVAGRGKRGGVRIIYYLRLARGQIWMLTLYAKNVADSIPVGVLKQIRGEIDAQG